MRLSKVRTITALAGIGAVAVVLLVAASWRDFYFAWNPAARLWGEWNFLEIRNLLFPNLGGTTLILEFKDSGKIVLKPKIEGVNVPDEILKSEWFLDQVNAESPFKSYQVHKDKISIFDGSGKLVVAWKFRFEGNDVLILEDEQTGQRKIHRVLPGS